MESFIKRVSLIQTELKAPKGQYNNFGKYAYRSCEDILEAAKPICAKHNTVLNLSDEIVSVGERYYVKATATLFDTESDNKIASTALAREAETKKGMDESQITGTASSYARKYALNGLFNIDDTKDADTNEHATAAAKAASKPAKPKEYKCECCGKKFEPYQDSNGKKWTSEQMYNILVKKYGKAICGECRAKEEAQK